MIIQYSGIEIVLERMGYQCGQLIGELLQVARRDAQRAREHGCPECLFQLEGQVFVIDHTR
ncbi:MAG: hypothetical protein U0Z44_02710 [Kouleothrix sp.]